MNAVVIIMGLNEGINRNVRKSVLNNLTLMGSLKTNCQIKKCRTYRIPCYTKGRVESLILISNKIESVFWLNSLAVPVA